MQTANKTKNKVDHKQYFQELDVLLKEWKRRLNKAWPWRPIVGAVPLIVNAIYSITTGDGTWTPWLLAFWGVMIIWHFLLMKKVDKARKAYKDYMVGNEPMIKDWTR